MDETQVTEDTQTPQTTEPTAETQGSVPGSTQTTPTAESQTQTVPPAAPNPVPGTAEPSKDAVTVNSNLRKVVEDLESVIGFVNTVLGDHPLASEIISDVTGVVEKVSSSL